MSRTPVVDPDVKEIEGDREEIEKVEDLVHTQTEVLLPMV